MHCHAVILAVTSQMTQNTKEESVRLSYALSKISPLGTIRLNGFFYRIVDWCWFYDVQALIDISLMLPDRFFLFIFVVAFSTTTKKNGKKQSGNARLDWYGRMGDHV